MFGPSRRSVANRLRAAAAWLRAFAFLEDGAHAAASDMSAAHPVVAAPEIDAPAADPRPTPHAHRRPLRPVAHARRPGEVAVKPMTCVTPLPFRAAAHPAFSPGRSTRQAVSRRLAP